MLSLSQTMRLEPQLWLKLTGGHTASIFPEVEEWLQESSDRQMAMKFMGRNFTMEYRSAVDYIFCAVFPQWKMSCRCFYQGNELPIRDLISPAERNYMQAKLMLALEVAYQLWCEKRTQSWKKVMKTVEALEAVA